MNIITPLKKPIIESRNYGTKQTIKDSGDINYYNYIYIYIYIQKVYSKCKMNT